MDMKKFCENNHRNETNNFSSIVNYSGLSVMFWDSMVTSEVDNLVFIHGRMDRFSNLKKKYCKQSSPIRAEFRTEIRGSSKKIMT